jgi:hypothetical protein
MMNPHAGLEERPASEASEDLLGQWPPVLRALGRLETAARGGNLVAMTEQLQSIRMTVKNVRTDALQPESLNLWNEFSGQLLVDLTLAQDRLSNSPLVSLGILGRSIENAGRHLGLPYKSIATAPSDPVLVEKLKKAVEAYLPLAKALAEDDDAGSKAGAASFEMTIAGLTLPEAKALEDAAGSLAATNDIKSRRTAFQNVSDALIVMVRLHGMDQLGDLYVVHCPMAFDDNGGDWLSAEPTVFNPYYGDEMLTCGSIKDTLSVKGGEQR